LNVRDKSRLSAEMRFLKSVTGIIREASTEMLRRLVPISAKL
jgi:hypothetical protein